MKIGILTHAYPPHPEDDLTRFYGRAARFLAEAGHEVHVVTNHAWFGATEPSLTLRYWREGNLHVHRIPLFDEEGRPPSFLRFFDVDPNRYPGILGRWAFQAHHLAALHLAEEAATLFTEAGLDVLEAPEVFGEAFYVARRRAAGARGAYPPLNLTLHGGTRKRLLAEKDALSLGRPEIRWTSWREEECLRRADGLLLLPPARLEDLEARGRDALPEVRSVLSSREDFAGLAAHLEKVAALGGSSPGEGPFRLPPRLLPGREPIPLPGKGLFLVDALSAPPEALRATLEAARECLPGNGDWDTAVLIPQEETPPPGWKAFRPGGPPPWMGRKEEDLLVYALAGARPDPEGLFSLLSLALQGGSRAFLWLRPGNAQVFPYRPDFGFPQVLLSEAPLPPLFSLPCGLPEDLGTFSRLPRPAARIAALMGWAAARGGPFLHTGRVEGDFYGDLPLLGEEDQQGALGVLDLCDLIPPEVIHFGRHDPAGPPYVPEEKEAPPAGGIPLEELERVYREHQNLKNLAPVRWMRKLGILDLARKVLPGVKKAIGPGKGKGS